MEQFKIKELRVDLEIMSDWLENKKLSANKGKTQIMITNGIEKIKKFYVEPKNDRTKKCSYMTGLNFEPKCYFQPTY